MIGPSTASHLYIMKMLTARYLEGKEKQHNIRLEHTQVMLNVIIVSATVKYERE